ncbi:hypothetical protein NQZ68_002976 [Dissostichus eleginoides]|nr:hypothetical protein NQZ68_002976 [Dissostichus eleginoides]
MFFPSQSGQSAWCPGCLPYLPLLSRHTLHLATLFLRGRGARLVTKVRTFDNEPLFELGSDPTGCGRPDTRNRPGHLSADSCFDQGAGASLRHFDRDIPPCTHPHPTADTLLRPSLHQCQEPCRQEAKKDGSPFLPLHEEKSLGHGSC